MVIRNTLLLCMLCTLPVSLFGQFRIGVAYEPGYFEAEVHNEVMIRQNDALYYFDEFSKLRFLHGLSIGGRYDLEGIALEFNLFTKLANKVAKDPAISSISDVKNKINYNFYGGAFGAEAMFGILGIGADINFSLGRIRANFEYPGKRETFTYNTLGNRVYMTFHFRSEGITSVAIRPYAQFYWDSWDQGPLDTFLNDVPYSAQPEKFNHFGISFIFLNGR